MLAFQSCSFEFKQPLGLEGPEDRKVAAKQLLYTSGEAMQGACALSTCDADIVHNSSVELKCLKGTTSIQDI